MNSDWTDCGNYLLNKHSQGSQGWLDARQYAMLTASNFGTAVGHNPYKLQLSLAYDIVESRKLKPADDSFKEYLLSKYRECYDDTFPMKPIERPTTDMDRARMAKGSEYEPLIRSRYCRERGVIVKEIGLALYKEDKRFGCSPDGLIESSSGDDLVESSLGDDLVESSLGDEVISASESKEVDTSKGMIEIKWVQRMQWSWWDEDTHPHPRDRIPLYHYDQMQGNMAILGRDWCDYIVCAESAHGDMIIERIPFDRDYWDDLYTGMKMFLDVMIPAVTSSL